MTKAAPRPAPPKKRALKTPGADAPVAAPKGSGPADDTAGPRYLKIARELTAAIADGTYPVGARLPTELELCAHFKISRFTAREAVRVLSSAGLITRRQRIGTVVIATPDQARYTHAVANVGDLFQYAQDTELRLMFIDHIALTKDRAAQFGAEPGEEWIYAMGLRRESALTPTAAKGAKAGAPDEGRPICVTRLFLSPALKGIESKLRERKIAVYAIIERDFGLTIQRVEQELQSVALEADDAANLGAQPGAPALRILRRYFDGQGRLIEVAENIHPGDRFTYRTQLRR